MNVKNACYIESILKRLTVKVFPTPGGPITAYQYLKPFYEETHHVAKLLPLVPCHQQGP